MTKSDGKNDWINAAIGELKLVRDFNKSEEVKKVYLDNAIRYLGYAKEES